MCLLSISLLRVNLIKAVDSQHEISVGELTALCRRGDINFRFSSRSSAQEGIAGHRKLQQRRGKDYFAEYSLSCEVRSSGLGLRVKGRADGVGYDVDRQQYFVDEIKTLRISVEDIPEDVMALYWHQACLYGAMLCNELNVPALIVRLCFYHLDDDKETVRERLVDRQQLHQLLVDSANYYLALLEEEVAWRVARAASMATMPFPYGEYRPGQRDMAVSVYRATSQQGQLVIQAPTGIGKTMATMYPAIQSLNSGASRRVFYLSARNSTQRQAQQAVTDLSDLGARVRSVVITAKDKVCFNPGEPCHPDHCSYARGYYDRVSEAIDDLLIVTDRFDRATIEDGARSHQVCPFELALDLSRRCDVIIADYNYVFDPVVYLRRFFDAGKRDSVILVDEVHNLVDRGREMFSAEVEKSQYLSIAKMLKRSPVCAPVVAAAKRVNTALLDYRRPHQAVIDATGYHCDPIMPDKVISAMQGFCSVAEEMLRLEGTEIWRDTLLQCYFDTLRFVRTAEGYDPGYVTLLMGQRAEMRLRLFCVNPAEKLGSGFDRTAAAVCFSATIAPTDYFRALLGTAEDAKWYRVPSPFPSDNLGVNVVGYIDTSYRGRQQSLEDLVTLIYDVMNSKAGNYIVFFPSHRYLQDALEVFVGRYPEEALVVQSASMSDDARNEFLAAFDTGPVCGFAVMGGVFSEGVDLKGDKLIGAIVVGVGLPGISAERDLVRDHFPGHGFEYAYQYPGMIRVLQTAGRVIRDASDRGIVCLVDHRYRESSYRGLLPAEWRLEGCRSGADLQRNLQAFWSTDST